MKRIFVHLLFVATLLSTVACSGQPSGSDLDQGINSAIQKKVKIYMPMHKAVSAEVLNYEIKNRYQRGEVWYFEYEARAKIATTTWAGKKETETTKVAGTALFEKRGSKWYSDMVE